MHRYSKKSKSRTKKKRKLKKVVCLDVLQEHKYLLFQKI